MYNLEQDKFFICFWLSLIGLLLTFIFVTKFSSKSFPKTVTQHEIVEYPSAVYMHNFHHYSYAVITDGGVVEGRSVCPNFKLVVNETIFKPIYVERWEEIKQFLNNRHSQRVCTLSIKSLDYVSNSG